MRLQSKPELNGGGLREGVRITERPYQAWLRSSIFNSRTMDFLGGHYQLKRRRFQLGLNSEDGWSTKQINVLYPGGCLRKSSRISIFGHPWFGDPTVEQWSSPVSSLDGYLQTEDCQSMVNGRLGDISTIFPIFILYIFHIMFPPHLSTYFSNPSTIHHPHSPLTRSSHPSCLVHRAKSQRPLRLCGRVPARERALSRLSSGRTSQEVSIGFAGENQLEHPLEISYVYMLKMD